MVLSAVFHFAREVWSFDKVVNSFPIVLRVLMISFSGNVF